MLRLRLAGAGAMGAATAQPNGVPVALHGDGSAGPPPVGFTVALLELDTPPAANCGVALIVNPAVALAAMPLAVVMVQTKSSPVANAPDEVQAAAVAPSPGVAVLKTKLAGNLSLTTMAAAEVAAPAALLSVSA